MVQMDADTVRRELDRILSSREFTQAGRMRRFLCFVVEEALSGRQDRLKEYAIATEVFDRDCQFDPRMDSVVRVEAGRLRAKLERYYQNEGADAAIVISLPRGGYAPVFGRPAARALAKAAATHRDSRFRQHTVLAVLAVVAVLSVTLLLWQHKLAAPEEHLPVPPPRVAVLPFTADSPSDTLLAVRLTEDVTAALAGRRDLIVVSSTTTRQFEDLRTRLRDVAEALDADILTGTAADSTSLARRIADAVAAASITVHVSH